MPFETPTAGEIISARRVLNMGPVSSFKTTAFVETWPRPAAILVVPGEKGDASIPRGLPDLMVKVWRDNAVERTASGLVVQEVETTTWELLADKSLVSFCCDGVHKYYGYILDWVTGGAHFRGEDFEPKLYARAHERFSYFIQRINASPIKYVCFTCWDGTEPDNPGTKQSPTHVYPELPGKMAKRIVGEFSVVVHSSVDWASVGPTPVSGPDKGKRPKAPAYWQLIPEGKVWGAAVKAPLDVVLRLPVKIPQSLPILEKTLEEAWNATRVIPSGSNRMTVEKAG